MEVPEKVMFDLGQKGSLESFRFLLVVFLKIKYSTLSKLGRDSNYYSKCREV